MTFFWSSTQTGLVVLPRAETPFKSPGSATVVTCVQGTQDYIKLHMVT